MLGGAFTTIGRHWKVLVGMALALFGGATVLLGIGLLTVISTVAADWDHLTSPGTPDPERLASLGITFGFLAVAAVIAYLLASAVVQASVPVVLQEAVLGRPIRFGTVWRRAWSRVWSMIGTLVLMALVAAVPVLLFLVAFIAMLASYSGSGSATLIWLSVLGWLATIPVALWLWVKFSLAPTIVVFEKQGPVAALRRSAQLVRDDWWRVFGITLLAHVMAAVAGYLIQMLFQMIGVIPGMMSAPSLGSQPSGGEILAMFGSLIVLTLISQLVAQLFSAVFPPLVTGLVYVDRRIRTENLGPVLAAAAAEQPLPEQYGPPPGAPA
ncbi:hypothetical protein [Streptomyces sp. NPDC059452]|uniref:DUF7847 domain-containing protein n=1 Tax=Streptomyces sp. NPDC059452 TaxID=3346835 RepID=UPI00368305B1